MDVVVRHKVLDNVLLDGINDNETNVSKEVVIVIVLNDGNLEDVLFQLIRFQNGDLVSVNIKENISANNIMENVIDKEVDTEEISILVSFENYFDLI